MTFPLPLLAPLRSSYTALDSHRSSEAHQHPIGNSHSKTSSSQPPPSTPYFFRLLNYIPNVSSQIHSHSASSSAAFTYRCRMRTRRQSKPRRPSFGASNKVGQHATFGGRHVAV